MSKQRRIIYNDDGAAEKPSHNPEATAAGFLDVYFNSAVDTQVDSWFYNWGNGWLTEEGELYLWGRHRRQSLEYFGDANQLIIEAARGAEMEIIASLRMNDTHDASMGIDEPFKLQHPELLNGEKYWPNQYPHLFDGEETYGEGGYPRGAIMAFCYSGFDFARPEVRQYRLDFIRQMCSEYDWDGLELDFVRMPLFFKIGEEEENLDTMSEFMRQVRALLDEIGQQRGRPYLLAVRVPPTPDIALRTGLDVERWLTEGCIDLLIAGSEWCCYYSTELKQFVDMGHKQGVPVYLNCPMPGDPVVGYNLSRPAPDPLIRGISSNFWALGADGIYLFNYPYVDKDIVAQWLNQIGDPSTLLGLDKLYLPEEGGGTASWEPGQGAYVTVRDAFPMHLIHGPSIDIMVGDDVQSAAQEGLLKEIRLQVGVENMHEVEGISIKVNGTRIPAADIERTGQDIFEVVLQTPPVQQGINQIVVLPGLGCIGRRSSTVTGLELWVCYKHE